jgi:hypothetical protein
MPTSRAIDLPMPTDPFGRGGDSRGPTPIRMTGSPWLRGGRKGSSDVASSRFGSRKGSVFSAIPRRLQARPAPGGTNLEADTGRRQCSFESPGRKHRLTGSGRGSIRTSSGE